MPRLTAKGNLISMFSSHRITEANLINRPKHKVLLVPQGIDAPDGFIHQHLAAFGANHKLLGAISASSNCFFCWQVAAVLT